MSDQPRNSPPQIPNEPSRVTERGIEPTKYVAPPPPPPPVTDSGIGNAQNS